MKSYMYQEMPGRAWRETGTARGGWIFARNPEARMDSQRLG